ncbi:MAG: hypothetical protein ABSG15_10395 [FCB group bacterium]|jgi:hypothetical protein
MAKHIFHEIIGNVFKEILNNSTDLYLDPACGGEHRLPFYISVNANRSTCVSNVDLILVKDEIVKLVCEIEESGFIPTKIYGKVFSTASALLCKLKGIKRFDVDKKGIFLHIISKNNIDKNLVNGKNTNKFNQFIWVEESIQDILIRANLWIKEYYLIFGDENYFKNGEKGYNDLQKIINIIYYNQ